MDFLSNDDVRQSDEVRKELQPYILSQYSASPTIYKLLSDFRDNIRPDADIDLFRKKIMNIETAEGVGLDTWGNILGITRNVLGMDNATVYTLGDDDYRKLLMYKALANITDSTLGVLNKMLSILLEGVDIIATNRLVEGTQLNGDYYNMLPMHVRFSVNGDMTDIEKALFVRGGLLCLATGVGWSIVFIEGNGVFGFRGSELQPFNQGVFLSSSDSIDDGGSDGEMPIDYSVIITQSANQTIYVVASKDGITHTYTDSFAVTENGWNLQILVEGASGYLAGNLIINGIEHTNKHINMPLNMNLNLSVTEAELGRTVYMNGTKGRYDHYYYFYSDEACTTTVDKTTLYGKVIVEDLSNGLPTDGEGITGGETWFDQLTHATEVDLSSVKVSLKTTLHNACNSCYNLRRIIGLDKWNPIETRSLESAFAYNTLLADIGDISRWKMPELTACSTAFKGCDLRSVDMHDWYTPSLLYAGRMFEGNSSLKVVDASGIDTRNALNTEGMFTNCPSLQYLIIDSEELKFKRAESYSWFINNTCKILVPRSKLNDYKTWGGWSTQANQFYAIEDYNIVRVNGQITVTPKEV